MFLWNTKVQIVKSIVIYLLGSHFWNSFSLEFLWETLTFPFSINTTLNMWTWMILPLDYSARFLFGGLFVLISFSKEVRGWESRFPRRKTETAFKGQWHTERREMTITQLWLWLQESSYRALSQFQRFPLSGLHHRLLTLYRNDLSECAWLRCYGTRWRSCMRPTAELEAKEQTARLIACSSW